jgi:hypothetical protein
MNDQPSAPLRSAVDAFIDTPTTENRDKLLLAADAYRDVWILAQASTVRSETNIPKHRPLGTTYEREIEVKREVDGLPVKLALQERTSAKVDRPWWTLSWRTKYSQNGSNRRFYMTNDGCWVIPAAVAMAMIEEMEALGGLDEKYFDHRRRPAFETLVSSQISPQERAEALAKVTGPAEDWGKDPFFVITSDPHDQWKKVLIVNTDTDTATFRSITTNPDYMPKKVLRPGEGWWLDNSMMDANVQQTRAFYSNLRAYLAGR